MLLVSFFVKDSYHVKTASMSAVPRVDEMVYHNKEWWLVKRVVWGLDDATPRVDVYLEQVLPLGGPR